MDWTDDRISELTKLWNEGLSTAEIGKLLGISKNAVVGKAHRLRLASRPSPIRRMAIRPATPRVPRATRNLAMSALPQTAAMTPARQAAPASRRRRCCSRTSAACGPSAIPAMATSISAASARWSESPIAPRIAPWRM